MDADKLAGVAWGQKLGETGFLVASSLCKIQGEAIFFILSGELEESDKISKQLRWGHAEGLCAASMAWLRLQTLNLCRLPHSGFLRNLCWVPIVTKTSCFIVLRKLCGALANSDLTEVSQEILLWGFSMYPLPFGAELHVKPPPGAGFLGFLQGTPDASTPSSG